MRRLLDFGRRCYPVGSKLCTLQPPQLWQNGANHISNTDIVTQRGSFSFQRWTLSNGYDESWQGTILIINLPPRTWKSLGTHNFGWLVYSFDLYSWVDCNDNTISRHLVERKHTASYETVVCPTNANARLASCYNKLDVFYPAGGMLMDDNYYK